MDKYNCMVPAAARAHHAHVKCSESIANKDYTKAVLQ